MGELHEKYKWAGKLKVEFMFMIPQQYNVDFDTSGGSLAIENLTYKIDAKALGA
jgi:hypothetical protein